MNATVVKFLKITIPLILGVFLIYYSYSKFSEQQLEEIQFHFKNANYGIVFLSVLLSVISHFLRAYRWQFMLEPLGYQPKLANSFMAINIAYLMNIFIPKSGEISRGIILDKYENVPFKKGFGTIISERVVDLIFLLGFTALALILQFDVLYNYLIDKIPVSKIVTALGILFALAIIGFLFLKYSKSNLQQKAKNFYLGLKEGVLSILHMRKKGAFILLSCIIWGLYILSFYTAFQALEETSTVPMTTIVIAFVVGSFTFAFTNSGFGFYPYFVAGILVIFNIPETIGTAFGWIVWTSNIASIVFFGALSFLLLPLYNKQKL
ncbi:MAG: flippase-like domain-containing protein [Flavobacteriaceae bacterium]|nr:flippase-like domain-containing protein [Flavobacteriaceae bacterium]